MKWDTVLRGIGVLALVSAYAVFRFSEGEMSMIAFTGVITAIVAIVAPEMISALPWGPSKN